MPARSRCRVRRGLACERLEPRALLAFSPPAVFPVGNGPAALALADIDGDERFDIVTADGGAISFGVLVNATPTGGQVATFRPQVAFATTGAPVALAVGDFNADGKPDVAVATAGAIEVYINNRTAGSVALGGTLSFSGPTVLNLGGAPTAVAIGDVNGDSKPDVVATSADNKVTVFTSTTGPSATAATFSTAVSTPLLAPQALVIRDLNADGMPDVAVACGASTAPGSVAILVNTTAGTGGSPSFAVGPSFPVGLGPRDIAADDFNADGRPDIAVSNTSSDSVSVVLNATVSAGGTPAFAAQTLVAVGSSPRGISVGDVNGDGVPDIAVANAGADTVRLLFNRTAALATAVDFSVTADLPAAGTPVDAAIGEFTGDGVADLAFAAADTASAGVLLQDVTAPTLSIATGATTLAFGESTPVTFTFSEPVSGFTNADVQVTGGTLTSFTGTGTSYTATFIAGTTVGPATISVAAGAYADLVGQTSSGDSSATIDVVSGGDTTPPTVAITASATALKAGGTATITFTLSEPCDDFTATDVLATLGTLTGFARQSDLVYTATFTPAAGVAGTASITVPPGAFTDSAGNANAGGTSTEIAVDTIAPTVSITSNATVLRVGETATLTFTLSEPSADFDATDVAVTRGALSGFTAAGGTVYTATFTPDANAIGEASIAVVAGTFTNAAGNANQVGAGRQITVATVAPLATITSTAATLRAGQTATIFFQLSVGATGFTDADIQVGGGTLSPLMPAPVLGEGPTSPRLAAIFTPFADSTAPGTITVPAGTFGDAVGNLNVASDLMPPIQIDTQPPAVTITASVAALKAGEQATITFTLSEPCDDFTVSHVVATLGTLTGFVRQSDLVYAATFTPDPGVIGIGSVSVPPGAFADGAGNATVGGLGTEIAVDTTPVNNAPAGTPKTVTTPEDTPYTFKVVDFGFSDPFDTPSDTLAAVRITTVPTVGTLRNGGVTVAAGSSVPAADIAAGRLVYVPAANVAGTTVFTFQVQDDGGTANGGVDLDPTPRTMTVSVTPVNDAPTSTPRTVTTLEDTPYTFTTEDFGFADPADVPANAFVSVFVWLPPLPVGVMTNNGVPVTFGSVIPAADIAAGRLVYTPPANGGGTNFAYSVRDDGGTANGGSDQSNEVFFPSIVVTPVNDAPDGTPNTVTTPEDGEYTFTAADFGFSDLFDTPSDTLAAVRITTVPTVGTLRNGGVTVAAGSSVPAADIAAGRLVYVPAANVAGTTFFTFQVQDDGGTANGGVDLDPTPRTMTVSVTPADSGAAAPTVAIGTSATTLKAGQTATISFVLSEPAFDFDADDVQVAGGTLSDFTGAGASYTATFTPLPDSMLPGTVSVPAGAFHGTGYHGYPYSSFTSSPNLAAALAPPIQIDTRAPTITIASSTPKLLVGRTATITFTLSEPAAGFTLAAIQATGGTLSGLSGSGTSYTAVFTPQPGFLGTGEVRVAAGAFTDGAGNPNPESAAVSFVIDTQPPTAIAATPIPAGYYKAGTVLAFTVGLSEPVTVVGAPRIPILVGNAWRHAVYVGSPDASRLRFAYTVKPGDNTPVGDRTGPGVAAAIDLAGGSIRDPLGNDILPALPTVGTADVVVDTVAPTVAVTSSRPLLGAGKTALMTFTLSEPSADFGPGSMTAAGGTLSAFAGSGTVYTAVFTPQPNLTGTAVVRVDVGRFNDLAGNADDMAATRTTAVDTALRFAAGTDGQSTVWDREFAYRAAGPTVIRLPLPASQAAFFTPRTVLSITPSGAAESIVATVKAGGYDAATGSVVVTLDKKVPVTKTAGFGTLVIGGIVPPGARLLAGVSGAVVHEYGAAELLKAGYSAAFVTRFQGGLRTAAADLDDNGFADLIVAPGGVPNLPDPLAPGRRLADAFGSSLRTVAIFDGSPVPAWAPVKLDVGPVLGVATQGGFQVATGDVVADAAGSATLELIVASGTRLAVYDVRVAAVGARPVIDPVPIRVIELGAGRTATGVAAGRLFADDPYDDVVVAATTASGRVAGTTTLSVLAGAALDVVRSFPVSSQVESGPSRRLTDIFGFGASLAVGDIDGNGRNDIVLGAGAGGLGNFRVLANEFLTADPGRPAFAATITAQLGAGGAFAQYRPPTKAWRPTGGPDYFTPGPVIGPTGQGFNAPVSVRVVNVSTTGSTRAEVFAALGATNQTANTVKRFLFTGPGAWTSAAAFDLLPSSAADPRFRRGTGVRLG